MNNKTFLTRYEAWKKGVPGSNGLGSFETNIFLAYRAADETNTRILQTSFPKLFVNKVVEYTQPVSKLCAE